MIANVLVLVKISMSAAKHAGVLRDDGSGGAVRLAGVGTASAPARIVKE